jgi:iron complex outermembrane recepter protein
MDARVRNTFASFLLLGPWLHAVEAQEQPASSAGSTDQLQTVVVTGTLIKRKDFDTPSPLQVLSADDLKNSGYTTISDVLRNISANGQGSLTQTNPFSFAGGASGIALRGLTVGATLTIVDGERMVAYPLTDDGQRTFVDTNSIPFSVVDHIEILKNGASAEYGSDAIAGVVNVILKKNFTGFQFNAEGGQTGKHDGATEHVNGIAGIGNLDSDGYNAFLSVEWRHQDPIYLFDRSGLWNNLNWTPWGGVNLTPGAGTAYNAGAVFYPGSLTGILLNPNTDALDGSEVYLHGACTDAKMFADQCTYLDRRLQIQPQTGNLNVLGRATKALPGDWQLSLTTSLFRSEAEQVNGHPTISPATSPNIAVAPGMAPVVVNPGLFPITVPTNYPGNTFGVPSPLVYNFPELGQEVFEYVTNTYRTFLDLKGGVAGWDLDFTGGMMYAAVTQKVYGQLNFGALQTALNNGYILGSSDATSLFAPEEEVKDTNSLQVLNVRATRSLFELPGGPLQLGTGVGFYHNYLNSPAPEVVESGQQAGVVAYASGGITNYAGFAELQAPLVSGLEVDASGRWDHYNTYGSTATPQFGVKYSPIRQIAFRGTWGQGFRAPNPAEAGNAASLFATQAYPDPILCKQTASGQQLPGSFYQTCTEIPTGLQTTNPDLKPERSINYTGGFILTPVEQLKVSLDYWDVKVKQDVVSASELVDLGVPQQSLQFQTVRGPQVLSPVVTAACVNNLAACPSALTPVGLIAYQLFPYVNATKTEVNGIDFGLESHVDVGVVGRLSATFNWTHTFHYYLEAPDGQSWDLAGTHGPTGVSGDTGNPKDRAVLTLGWDRGGWSVNATVNYTSSFSLTDPSVGLNTCGESIESELRWIPTYDGPASFCKVDHFTDTDLYGEYSFNDHFKVHASILNVFNTQPPLDLQTYGSAGNYSNAFADAGAIGRFFSVGLTYTL